jgi:hypothetical protein
VNVKTKPRVHPKTTLKPHVITTDEGMVQNV